MSSGHASGKPPGDTTSFGFRDVPAEARQGLVNEVFAAVAGRYDLMNDLMSGGLHRLWKDDLVAWLAPPKSARAFDLVDVAGGTGDITRRVLEAGGAGCRAVLIDISPEMVEVGRKRLTDAGLGARVGFAIAADSQQRKGGRIANAGDIRADEQALGAGGFRRAGSFRIVHRNDQRDPVALGDRLAQAAVTRHQLDHANREQAGKRRRLKPRSGARRS